MSNQPSGGKSTQWRGEGMKREWKVCKVVEGKGVTTMFRPFMFKKIFYVISN